VSGAVQGFDVAVVGAGIIGLAVARELVARDRSVCVLEAHGIGSGASGVQPGGIRQQWGTRVNCRLARESIAFYADATERLASPIPLRLDRCGYLFLADTETELARLAEGVRLQNDEGVPSRLVRADDVAELVPGIDVSAVAGGAWCEEDGYMDRPQSVVEAFARGLDVRIEHVREIVRVGTGWRLGSIAASSVVVAAGVETPRLLRPLDLQLPIEPEDRYLFLSDRIGERLLEPLVVSSERALAVKQLADGRVLSSDLAARGDESGRDRWRANIRRGVEGLLPRLTHVSFPTLVNGVYDVTPDHQPALGPVPGHEALFVAAGFSGHGFMLAPAVGRILADAVTGEAHDPALETLGAGRFFENRLVPERQLV
jgi:sarcosine oxidase subunit beta